MKKTDIAIVMGSDSDFQIIRECMVILARYNVAYETHILSAHRTPNEVRLFSQNAHKKGIKVIIAGAGGAAHLAGVIASHTILPVIGIPIASSDLNGLDSLLSTVQMPSGIPVATVAIGKAGAHNAALLALQILAISNKRIQLLLKKHKSDLVKKVKAKNSKLKNMVKDL